MGGRKQRLYRKNKILDKQISHKANQFIAIDSLDALLDLLKVTRRELVSLINLEYKTFFIKKGKNGLRKVHQPSQVLMFYQSRLNDILSCVYLINPSPFCYSYTPSIIVNGSLVNKNILEASKMHINKPVILKIDIEDFFPSINIDMIKELFSNQPFSFNSEVTDFLAHSLTLNGVLPTGSPTSPILSNFIFKPIDEKIRSIPGDFNYTRYADDLTFSFPIDNDDTRVVLSRVTEILNLNNFKINSRKTKFLKPFQRQEINGIVVNKKLNINRKYYKNLRAILHSIEKFGFPKAAEKYKKKNIKAYCRAIRNYYAINLNFFIPESLIEKKLHPKGEIFFMNKSLRAKIGYIGSVRGKEDVIYKRLLNSFKQLKESRYRLKSIVPELESENDLVFFTNATSKSVVFYAFEFLRNFGFSNQKIDDLRIEHFIKKDKVDFNLMHKSFINQSLHFIELYTLMRTENNFERMVKGLVEKGKFNKIFKFNSSEISLIEEFNREIFHSNLTCSYMRSHYKEESEIHNNTGVFAENQIKKEYEKYFVEKEYLIRLGMRKCKKC